MFCKPYQNDFSLILSLEIALQCKARNFFLLPGGVPAKRAPGGGGGGGGAPAIGGGGGGGAPLRADLDGARGGDENVSVCN